MQQQRERSADELLMGRELKDVGAGELVGAADEHDKAMMSASFFQLADRRR